jgi:23S rRNA (pseudouridine1915-N3)-methyltransferase
MDQLATYGNSKVAFVIGGSLGLSDTVMKRADETLSFSKMTFPSINEVNFGGANL